MPPTLARQCLDVVVTRVGENDGECAPRPRHPVRRAGPAPVARGRDHLDHHGWQGRHPQPNPVGFLLQDDNSILIYNEVKANRINHVIDRPRVALHFDGDGAGGDIVVFTGTARRADDIPLPHENQTRLAKNGERMAWRSGSAEKFSKDFPVPLRIEITRTRGY